MSAGINEEGVDLHALPYTFEPHLIRSGANTKIVQELMGHAGVRITQQVYARAFNPDKRSAVSDFDEIIDERATETPKQAMNRHGSA